MKNFTLFLTALNLLSFSHLNYIRFVSDFTFDFELHFPMQHTE